MAFLGRTNRPDLEVREQRLVFPAAWVWVPAVCSDPKVQPVPGLVG